MGHHTIRADRKTAPATFASIYITQPVLRVIREEFGISAARTSLAVSSVIFGIALATLPFGLLVDRTVRLLPLPRRDGGYLGERTGPPPGRVARVVALVACFLLVPFAAGLLEARAERGR